MTISPDAGVALLVATAAATSHLYLAAAGFGVTRYRLPAAYLFSVACAAMAWATFTTALQPVLAHTWPAVYALSPMLSGYGAPALALFTLRAVHPKRPPSPAWLLVGLPGTIYALLVLASPGHLSFVVHFRDGTGPRWSPILSPVYLAHCIQMTVCVGVSGAALVRALRHARPGPYRDGLRWLAAAQGLTLLAVALYSVLPGVHVLRAVTLAPWSTSVPMVAFLYRGLHALAEDWGGGTGQRAAVAQQRLQSVAEATRGVSEGMAALVCDARAHADALSATNELPAERRAHTRALRQLLGEAERLTDRMARYARGPSTPPMPLDVAARVRTAARAAGGRAGCTVPVEVAPDAETQRVRAAPTLFDAAVDALVTNAVEAGAAPRVRVAVERPAVIPVDAMHPALDGEDALRIEVIDAGEGMDEASRERAVEPFFTTRDGHAGLGLVDVVSLVRGAGGALHLTSAPGRGTTVTLWLPIRADDAPADDAAGERCDADVALISDDTARTGPLALMLDARGLRCRVYATAATARGALLPSPPAAVLIDLDSTDRGMLPLTHELLRAARAPQLTVLGGRPSDVAGLGAGDTVFRMARDFRLATVAAHVHGRVQAGADAGTQSVTQVP